MAKAEVGLGAGGTGRGTFSKEVATELWQMLWNLVRITVTCDLAKPSCMEQGKMEAGFCESAARTFPPAC